MSQTNMICIQTPPSLSSAPPVPPPRRRRALALRGGIACLALAAAAPACVSGPIESEQDQAEPAEIDDQETTGEAEQALAPSSTITVPIAIHFLWDHTDVATGLPAYYMNGQSETILDVDAAIAAMNVKLDAARGDDLRRLKVMRVSVRYQQMQGGCPDPVALMEPHHVHGALNLLMTSLCAAPMASATWATRTDAGALAHEVGHNLGLLHTFEGNNVPGWVEMLARDEDPASPTSCYRRGDSVCDTPPDYGYAGPQGEQDNVMCDSLIPGTDLCVQDGMACRADDLVVDQRYRTNGQKVCVNLAGGVGRRTYDAFALGLIENNYSNVMAYFTQNDFTYGQFLRMHGFSQWRLRVPDRVPASEKPKLLRMVHGPADPVFDKTTSRDYALANTQLFTYVWSYGVPASTAGDGLTASTTMPMGQSRRVFSPRVRATISGTPSSFLKVTITAPDGTSVEVPRMGIRVLPGELVVDEGMGQQAQVLEAFRGRRTHGTWTVKVRDTLGSVTVSSLKLEVMSSDRAPIANDRAGRGVGDVMMYRPSSNQLFTSSNLMNGQPHFATGQATQVAAAPWPDSIVTGDIDGDGLTDLLSRSGSTIKVAFASESYDTWYSKSISGADLPLSTDEVLLGDFDGDGFADLMRRRKNVAIDRGQWKYHRGRGDGTFEAGVEPGLSGNSGTAYVANVGWTVGDFNGDGRADILVRYKGTGLFWLSRNSTAAPGQTPTFFGGSNPTIGGSSYAYYDSDRLMAMDANGDGRDDIVVRRPSTGQWWTSLNVNDLTYGAGTNPLIGGSSYAYLATDIPANALP